MTKAEVGEDVAFAGAGNRVDRKFGLVVGWRGWAACEEDVELLPNRLGLGHVERLDFNLLITDGDGTARNWHHIDLHDRVRKHLRIRGERRRGSADSQNSRREHRGG